MTEIIPCLFYRDVPAALDWLASAFGFHETMRQPKWGCMPKCHWASGGSGAPTRTAPRRSAATRAETKSGSRTAGSSLTSSGMPAT